MKMKARTKQRLIRGVAILVTLVFLARVGWWLTADVRERHTYYRFDSELWQETPARQRYYMAMYIRDHQQLHGKTPAEVRALLGEPTRSRSTDSRLSYDLGVERGYLFNIDHFALELTFSHDTEPMRLIEAKIVGD